MSFDDGDLDGEALRFFADCEADPEYPPPRVELVRRHPLVESVEFVTLPHPYPYRANTSETASGLARIEIDATLGPRGRAWKVSHEALEHCERHKRYPYAGTDVERLIDRRTARIVVPAPALRTQVRAWGPTALTRLADTFTASQLTVAVRLGESLGYSVGLIGANHAFAVDPNNVLGAPARLAKIARRGGDRHFHVVRLTDIAFAFAVIWKG